MTRRIRLDVADTMKVCRWVEDHKDVLLGMQQIDAIRKMKKDIGILIGRPKFSEFERAVGIVRRKGGSASNRRDRSVVIAKALIGLMTSLGQTPPDDLLNVVREVETPDVQS